MCKSDNLLVQANDLVLEMLREDYDLLKDSINLLWTGDDISVEGLRERDRQINRYVRDVRKKILTHLSFSGLRLFTEKLTL